MRTEEQSLWMGWGGVAVMGAGFGKQKLGGGQVVLRAGRGNAADVS